MNNKAVGTIFCLISAILISTKYISAAIFISNTNCWDAEMFKTGLDYVGPVLTILAIISLIVGILFLGYEVYEDIHKKNK